ncbi:MAG TPA: argininosuccinate lyase [Candidatus Bathyarchaeia archaeon]|nr:argininosuccinate lyase [Candidatus Bathyarchaeia archaeon]
MKENVIRRGRLSEFDTQAQRFVSSIDVDDWFFGYDILVDLAHIAMLNKQGIIEDITFDVLRKALLKIRTEGYDTLPKDADDVHLAIESVLTKRTGSAHAGWLHVGRSRNDEVATCIRMALRTDLLVLLEAVLSLQHTLLEQSARNVATIMPGFTHLQHAQPTTLGHHLLAHHDAFERDLARLTNAYVRTNQSPLGAAAFASTAWPLDRDFVASALGFDGIVENSMDAVSTRDFVIESLAAATNAMISLSRLAEELILWSTSEFGYVEIDDKYASTSSIMPQKKNPDTLELIRAKMGSVVGDFTASAVICKGLPLSYNLDVQEITPHVRKAIATTIDCTHIASAVLQTLSVNMQRLAEMSSKGFTTATELADTIARTTRIPFRTAHTIVGDLARVTLVNPDAANLDELDKIGIRHVGKPLSQLGLTESDIVEALDVDSNIAKRFIAGGPAASQLKRMLKTRRRRHQTQRRTLLQRQRALMNAENSLLSMAGA